MTNNDFSKMTDQELLDEAKKLKSFSFINALLIGILIGIIAYSIFVNSWGLLTLILLFFIYKMVNDPRNKRKKDLEQLIKERNLE